MEHVFYAGAERLFVGFWGDIGGGRRSRWGRRGGVVWFGGEVGEEFWLSHGV